MVGQTQRTLFVLLGYPTGRCEGLSGIATGLQGAFSPSFSWVAFCLSGQFLGGYDCMNSQHWLEVGWQRAHPVTSFPMVLHCTPTLPGSSPTLLFPKPACMWVCSGSELG